MNPIKIHPNNATEIEAALRAVNGVALAHTFSAYSTLAEVAELASEKLTLRLGKGRSLWAGARFRVTSGGTVAKSYARKGYSRIGTTVTLLYKAGYWHITHIQPATLYVAGGGFSPVILTPEQHEHLRTKAQK